MQSAAPTKIQWHKKSNTLGLIYGDAECILEAEFLRVHSTSAEVKGHGPDQAVLVFGKIDVKIKKLEPVGNYGLKITFDDGHDTGIYTWPYLQELCDKKSQYWQEYLDKLKQENQSRDPHTNVVQFPQ